MTAPVDEWASLIDEFESIRRDMLRLVEDSGDLLKNVHPEQRESARNLLHYLALRSRDLRPLQARLAAAGLSSLGRAESHVLAAVDSVLFVLRRLAGRPIEESDPRDDRIDLAEGQRLLDAHTEAALGPRPAGRGVAIMVTMPSEAADDYTLVMQLVEQGMDCMRINCAHDNPERWARMIEHLKRAVDRHGRSCRILMDLAGPKIRTGAIEPGPAVVKFRPQRDAYGRVIEPARVWLFPEEQPRPSPTPADASLPVPGAWLRELVRGDRLHLVDARDASRVLRVVAVDAEGCWAESKKTCYIEPGTSLRVERPGDGTEDASELEAKVGLFPPAEARLELTTGDELIVTRPSMAGRNAVRNDRGRVLTPAMIGCTAEQIFDDVRSGDRVWFDDGRIGGVVERCEPDRLHVRITRTRARGARLGPEKGINLPDTVLHLAAITDKDRADLAFGCGRADLIALSFVNSVDDVRELRALLEPMEETPPAIVLKIETRRGFDNLPAMLLEAMKAPRSAVMIARGDLAVECGFERMAEVQEEILWLCEAAHVPVIWATQVLETLAREGMPSRAEVTDAAMAHRAECVMLNKGPYVVQAVNVLDDILRRMHGHQAKKQSMLRELRLVSGFRTARARRHTAPPRAASPESPEPARSATNHARAVAAKDD
ncbi:MAG TPA: pyruvate kinase [Vicinamibacterales bacterium]|nr:pyruvate kinase [Vicinamibacterales bacterium]